MLKILIEVGYQNNNLMKLKKAILYLIIFFTLLGIASIWTFKKFDFNPELKVGQKIDSLNNVYVYYNGGVSNVIERNTSKYGYNIGLKYQCVEFVKRYYFEYLKHKMPDSYGNAKDFFDKTLLDGQISLKRNLVQYTNPSQSKPKIDDILIFEGTFFNRYGHVAIISNVTENEIEILQQNPGPFSKSRETFKLGKKNGKWEIKNERIMGWLRMKDKNI